MIRMLSAFLAKFTELEFVLELFVFIGKIVSHFTNSTFHFSTIFCAGHSVGKLERPKMPERLERPDLTVRTVYSF